MKIRIMGLPAELGQAAKILQDADALDVIEASDPYPNRGNSHIARLYIEARLSEWCDRSWHDGDCCEASRKQWGLQAGPRQDNQDEAT